MNLYVLTRTMKIGFLCDGHRLRASPRHGWTRRLIVFQLLIRRGGVPSGAAAFIVTEKQT
jgi:hypothetical protein